MMLIVFLIGFQAVASKASPLGEEGRQAVKAAEATTAVGTSLDSADTIHAGELEKFTGSSPSATIEGSTAPKPSGLDILPFPLSLFIRFISKEALNTLDLSSVCDTIQMLDWKTYRDLLLKEDYAGFQQKLSQDEIVNTLGETFQDYLMKYYKFITEGDTSAIEKNIKEILKVIPLDKSEQYPVTIGKTIKEWTSLLASERNIARGGVLAMQKYVKLVQDSLHGGNLLNATDFSQKNAIEKALNGKGA